MDEFHRDSAAAREGELLRLLAENIRDYAIFVIDGARRVQTWTPGAERLLGYREEEILGRSADIFFTPEDNHAGVPQREVTAALATGRGEDDRWHVHKDGSRLWISGMVTPLWEENGTLRGFAKIMRDRTDWKLADQARRKSEDRLRTLLDRLPHGAVFQAVQNRGSDDIHFTYVSAGVEEIFGTSPDDMVADAAILQLCVPPAQRQQASQQRAAIASGDASSASAPAHDEDAIIAQSETEFRYNVASGRSGWIHCQSAAHYAFGGEVVWEGVMLDVTHRKEAELALRDHEASLSLALEAGRMGTWQWSIATGEVIWSPQLEAIHGLEPGTFPGTFEAYQQDMHPEDRELVLTSIAEAVNTGKEHHLEYRLVWPDGSIHWIEARGRLYYDEAGRPARMLGICMEITTRKQIENDLRFLAEASRSLAKLVDYESTLQKVSGLAVPHFADWCAVYLPEKHNKLRQSAVAHADPSKVQLAQELAERWPPDPTLPGGIYEVFRTGKAVLIEEVSDEMLQAAAHDAEHLAVLRNLGLKSYMCMPLVIREGTIGVITFTAAESGRRYTSSDLALAEDLARRAAIATENARLYAKLREEGRRKDEFLAMLGHELRNPLASIRSGTDLLRMLESDNDVVETMQQQTEHLIRLVDDLMDVSRVMRGRVELRKEPVELSTIVSRAVDSMRPMIAAHQQQLSVELSDEPIWIHADKVRLTQVITNLLNNASKYTETGGRITVSTEPQPNGVLLRVQDTGIGIDKDTLDHVFGLFTQANRSLDRSQGGLGIGLTVVKSLVEGHGGSVAVHSEGPDMGSEFTVWLPTSGAPNEQTDEEPNAEAQSGPQRILIVDDNVPAVKMLSRLLNKIGTHQIYTAYDGLAALEAARQHQPDLILLDIGLPKLDGFEVVRQLRRQPEFHQTRIVALTGYGTAEDRRQSLAAGFDEHLIKPPGTKDLRQLLN